MFIIEHKKSACIGCKLCEELAPLYFELGEDGLAQLLNSRQQGLFQLVEGFDEDLPDIRLAEQSCPVKVIRIR